MDIGEKQDKKRRKRVLKLDREFNAKAMKQSRNRYRRTVCTTAITAIGPRS